VVVPVDTVDERPQLVEENKLEKEVLGTVVLGVVEVPALARANRVAKTAAKAQIISCDLAIFPDFSFRLLTRTTGRDENVPSSLQT